MTNLLTNNQSPQANKFATLNHKMLILAQELLLEEMINDTLLSCGEHFTSKFSGRYGVYEIIKGEVVVFQPQIHLQFLLISEDFVVSSNLAMIKTITSHLDEYELSLTQ